MTKRVSVKGKGADLFFGDLAPPIKQGAEVDLASPSAPDAPSDMLSPPVAKFPPLPAENNLVVGSKAGQPSARRGTLLRHSVPEVNGELASSEAQELASELANTSALSAADAIEPIRKVVKVPGREVSFVRLSPEEKTRVVDIVYTYRRQGQKTTENEISRIALNFLLHDYDEHGELSVLARVLAALRA